MAGNKSQLHYLYNLIYPVGILIAVIIVLFTVEWGNIPEFVKYVTFGLTLTSLILSLLAIIYMIVSQISYSRGINVLQDASNAVSGATDKLAEVTAGLDSKVESIPVMIKEVGERVDARHQELLQQIGTGKGESGGPAVEAVKLSADLVAEFLKSTSFNGALALLACQLAAEKKLPFNSVTLWKEAGPAEDYISGFLNACGAFGLVDFNIKEDMWNITEFSELLPKDMREVCKQKARTLGKSHPEFSDLESTLENNVEVIYKYFED